MLKSRWVKGIIVLILMVALAACGSGQTGSSSNSSGGTSSNSTAGAGSSSNSNTGSGSGSGSSSGSGSGSSPAKVVNLVIASGPTGGAFYPIAGGIAQIVNDHVEGVKMDVQVTGGGVENTRVVGTGQVDLGFFSARQGIEGMEGTGTFEGEDLKLEALGTLHSTGYQVVALKKSNIKTLEDIKGKKIAIGEPGGGAETFFAALIEAAGWNANEFNTVYLPYDQAADQMKDGLIDVMIVVGGMPTASVESLATTHEVTLVSIPSNVVSAYIQKTPSTSVERVEAGIYKGVDEPVDVFVERIQLGSRAGLDPDIAYNITKALYSNLDVLATYHSVAKGIKIEYAHEAVVPLNEGAKKYFQEIGNIK